MVPGHLCLPEPLELPGTGSLQPTAALGARSPLKVLIAIAARMRRAGDLPPLAGDAAVALGGLGWGTGGLGQWWPLSACAKQL